ncbi:MAG: COX15/CtaA family protein, partial [Clostridia bacterium]
MPNRALAALWWAATVLTYGLVILGGFVTSTASGFGCGPDWPVCGGHLLPPANIHADIEWSHRLVAGILTLLVLTATVVTFRLSKSRRARILAGVGIILLLAQVALGAAIVLNGIPPLVVAIHDGVATAFLAILLVQALSVGTVPAAGRSRQGAPVLWAAAAVAWLTVVLGSYLAHLELHATGFLTSVRVLGTAGGRYAIGPGWWHWIAAALLLTLTGLASHRARQLGPARPWLIAAIVALGFQAALGVLLLASGLAQLILAIHEAVGVATAVLFAAAAVRSAAWEPTAEGVGPSLARE